MSSHLLSIIIPTYNAASCVQACLHSVSEVLKGALREVEVIVKDGGSTDETLSIVEEFRDRLPLVVLTGKDRGVFDAMNIGLSAAKGEWVYFLGSDDKILDEFVNGLYHIQNSESDVTYGNVRIGEHRYAGKLSREELITRTVHHQSAFYRKTLFEKYGTFDISYPVSADYHRNIIFFSKPDVSIDYMDLVLAEFNLGGLSTLKRDRNFIKDQPELIEKAMNETIEPSALKRLIRALKKKNGVVLMDDGKYYFTGLKMYIGSLSLKEDYPRVFYFILGSFWKKITKRSTSNLI